MEQRQSCITLIDHALTVQVERRLLYVNVTATLGVDMAPGATPDEVEAAMDLTSLSADDPIGLLSNDPDKFFGRTTKVGSASLERCHALGLLLKEGQMLALSACPSAKCAANYAACKANHSTLQGTINCTLGCCKVIGVVAVWQVTDFPKVR